MKGKTMYRDFDEYTPTLRDVAAAFAIAAFVFGFGVMLGAASAAIGGGH